jgi:hypothetical protein
MAGESDGSDELNEERDSSQSYLKPEQIDTMALATALRKFELFDNDPFLRMQAINLNIVDRFSMDLEYRILRELFDTERTPPAAHFLSAQSQMWIFAAYELLRTWRQRAKEIVAAIDNGGLQQMLNNLKSVDDGYMHIGREFRIDQLEEIIKNPDRAKLLEGQLRITHCDFRRLLVRLRT